MTKDSNCLLEALTSEFDLFIPILCRFLPNSHSGDNDDIGPLGYDAVRVSTRRHNPDDYRQYLL